MLLKYTSSDILYIIEVVMLLAAFVALAIAAVSDRKSNKIPNRLTLPMIGVGLCYQALFPTHLLNSILATIILVSLAVLTPSLGMGDIKLLIGLSYFVNPIIVMILIAIASLLVVIVQALKSPHSISVKFKSLLLHNFPKHNTPKTIHVNAVPFALYLLAAAEIVIAVLAIAELTGLEVNVIV